MKKKKYMNHLYANNEIVKEIWKKIVELMPVPQKLKYQWIRVVKVTRRRLQVTTKKKRIWGNKNVFSV